MNGGNLTRKVLYDGLTAFLNKETTTGRFPKNQMAEKMPASVFLAGAEFVLYYISINKKDERAKV
jgi:hypothetical protein